MLPPVRLCCGQAHWTVQCPDGKVMCCLCFGRFSLDELNAAEDGSKEDACRECAFRDHRVVSLDGWTCDTCGLPVNGQTDEQGVPTIRGDHIGHLPP